MIVDAVAPEVPDAGAAQQRNDKATLAARAAARAAQHATPAQRERLVLEAAAQAMAEQQQAELPLQREPEGGGGAAAPQAPRPPTAYEPPAWAGDPAEGVDLSMLVLKGGAVAGRVHLAPPPAGRHHVTFGRAPDCDIVLDHPSSSRLHAVLQFRGSDGRALLYDPGSTHGTFVNKARLPPREYQLLSVGDQVRFGESSRLHVLEGPEGLLPEEGPNREQRRQMRALQAIQARREREAAVAAAQMGAALGGGASWGMHDDDDDGEAGEAADDEAAASLDWRSYAATRGLSDKQQKLADRVRKREAKVQSLQREVDKIKAKQGAMEELTPGQAEVLLRNERGIDAAMAELEDLEDELAESIRETVKARAGAAGPAAAKKKRRRGSDDEYAGSSDDDTFYDRTAAGRPKRGGARRPRPGAPQAEQEVADAASLCAKRQALQEERAAVEAQLQQEERAQRAKQPPACAGDREGQEDPLDAFMAGVVEVALESEGAAALRRRLSELDAGLERTERLLRIADPDGYFKTGSRAATAAVDKARRALDVDSQRRAAEARQRALREAAEKAEVEARAQQPEEEEDEAPPPPQQPASVHRLEASAEVKLVAGLEVRPRPPPAVALAAAAAPAAAAAQPAGLEGEAIREARRAEIAAKLAAKKGAATPADAWAGAAGHEDATAQVLADLEVLSRARRGAAAEQLEQQQPGEAMEPEHAGWRPPKGQRGDGRTDLNAKLGY